MTPGRPVEIHQPTLPLQVGAHGTFNPADGSPSRQQIDIPELCGIVVTWKTGATASVAGVYPASQGNGLSWGPTVGAVLGFSSKTYSSVKASAVDSDVKWEIVDLNSLANYASLAAAAGAGGTTDVVVIGPLNGDGSIKIGGGTAALAQNGDGSLQVGGGTSKLLQAGSGGITVANDGSNIAVVIRDPSNSSTLPVAYDGVGSAPATGMWRGFGVATAAGLVEIKSTDGVTVQLGTAAGAGASFSFTLFITQGGTVTLTNCSVGGGGIST